MHNKKYQLMQVCMLNSLILLIQYFLLCMHRSMV